MHRRDFIAGAATLAATKAAAFPRGSGANSSCFTGVSQPAPALSAGFNCLSFFDDFTSTSTIDVNNTQTGNYLWRVAVDAANHNLLPPSGISVSGSILTLSNPNSTVFPGLFSAFSPHNDGVQQGHTFPNGGYFECSMAFDPTLALTSDQSIAWPAFVFTNYNFITLTVPFTELDFWEAYPSSNGAISKFMSVNQLTSVSGGNLIGYNNPNSNVNPLPGSPNFTAQHKYGTLWVPMSKNGGTGLIKRYFDGVHLDGTGGTVNADITYTASGSPTCGGVTCSGSSPGYYSELDGMSNVIALYPGPGAWSVQIDYVMAWT